MNVRSGHLKVAFAITVLLTSFVIFGHIGIVKASSQKVYIIPLFGTVDPGMAGFTELVLKDQADDPGSFLLLNWLRSAAVPVPIFKS